MPKINRPSLARGTKVVTEHMTSPMTQAAALVNNCAFDRDNLVANRGTARVNFHVPQMDSNFWKYAKVVGNAVDFCLPFTLPPLQEFFDSNGIPGADTPNITLDEFTLSFDQRAESAAITDSHGNGGDTGLIDYIDVTRLNLSVALVEKPQRKFSSAIGYTPEREVFSATIPQTAFAGTNFRANPFILTSLGKALSPYKTYMLMISCPDLYIASGTQLVLPALSVSLKISHPLVTRDLVEDGTQNIPNHGGHKTPPTIVVPNPTSADVIRASTSKGIQTGLNTLDNVMLNKLEGGYTWDSGVPVYEEVETDSTYDVIMVPMWQNCPSEVNAFTSDTVIDPSTVQVVIPYLTGVSPYNGPTCDRRFIPLPFPFVIHHVMAIANYGYPGNAVTGDNGNVPVGNSLTTAVGVGINSTLRSDYAGCSNVAYADWTPDTKSALTIDQIKARPGGTLTQGAYDFEILSVPLVGTGGTGYYPQGMPVYCGRATTANTNRTSLNGGTAVNGLEQFLECRWFIQDTNGLENPTLPHSVYAGNGGNWIQIIGKKTACIASGDLPQ